VEAGGSVQIVFTATVGSDEAFYGRTITNTAEFVSDNAGSGSDDTGAAIEGQPKTYLYLPIVVRGD
jgi:hypothetical protein